MKAKGKVSRAVMMMLGIAALAGSASVISAGSASASGSECGWQSIDGNTFSQCTNVTGSGVYVDYVTIAANDGGSSPFAFPNATNCTFRPGFNIVGAGEGFESLKAIACSAWQPNGGSYVFSEDKSMAAGEYCGFLYFPIYNQSTGDTNDCVGVHS